MRMNLKIYSLFFAFWCIALISTAQEGYTLQGSVVDEDASPLPYIAIGIKDSNQGITSDEKGVFMFKNLTTGSYTFVIRYTGYMDKEVHLVLNADTTLNHPWVMEKSGLELGAVEIQGKYEPHKIDRIETISTEVVHNDYIRQNLGGSLIQTLEKLPGIKSLTIGASSSKPLIRGLGFNEVAVVEDGIKHEGQQWGADHGLEVDQFNAGTVEISKGPASFIYGSDAIGGVIVINATNRPLEQTSGGSMDLVVKSNNMQLGSSLYLFTRKKQWYVDGRLTYLDYEDYKVPTQTIYPYSYAVNLHKNRVRNTAGKEFDKFFRTGYVSQNFSSEFYFSNYYDKEGSFANAHGLEPIRVDEALHDASSRDIQLPFALVSHSRIINRTEWNTGQHRLKFDFGFQNNFRQEQSIYRSHGYMPAIYPDDRPDHKNLEMEFLKNVYSANIRDQIRFKSHHLTLGINGEIQQNTIKGWGFLIPAFNNYKLGGFIYDKWELNNQWKISGALRFDVGQIDIREYRDWFPSELKENGNLTLEYLQRAPAFSKRFNSITYSLGILYKVSEYSLTANIGKSFRMPIANELAANGVNYDYFRFEKGNKSLDPEESYQIDIGLDWVGEHLHTRLTPFVNYFSNFIYLNPTSEYDINYGAGNQVFEYNQSAVFRSGFECMAEWEISNHFEIEGTLEYVYNRQLTGDKKGYTLPFTPPLSGLVGIKYMPTLFQQHTKDNFIKLEARLAAKQHRIVPPEDKTPGFNSWNIGFGTTINLKNQQTIHVGLNINNLFNTKYFDHTNYYRIIQLPEQGRNIVLTIHVPFNIGG